PVMAGPRDWPQASPNTCLVPAIHDVDDVAEASKSRMTETSHVVMGEMTGMDPVTTEGEPTDDTESAHSEGSRERSCADPSPSSRGAQRRGDPGQRDKRFSRGPGSPRRQKATRNDGAPAAGPSDPPAEAAPADAPATAPATAPAPAPPQPTPAAPRIVHLPYPPGSTTIIRIGAARLAIPPPKNPGGATRHTQAGPPRLSSEKSSPDS